MTQLPLQAAPTISKATLVNDMNNLSTCFRKNELTTNLKKRKDRVDDFWNECEKVSPSTGETAQTNGQYATYKHNKLKLFACALRPYLNFETRFYKTEE